MKFNISKKQRIIILTVLIFLLIFFVVYIFIINKDKNIKINNNEQPEIFVPTFLTEAEKTRLNIQPDNKIQVLKRNAAGKIILYKVIKKDSDIITNLDQITAVSPVVNK